MELLTTPTLADLAAADSSARLVLSPAAGPLRRLVTLLSRGCFVRVVTGSSLRTSLIDQFHVDPGYLEKEIKIVFLDSSPVDDLDGAIVRDSARVALSAAMPGLVGAAMRRDGPSWLRASITHHETNSEQSRVAEGVIFLKLFNRVMEDLGEGFLRRGVYVEAPQMASFLERLDEPFWRNCPIELNGETLTPGALKERLAGQVPWLRLAVPTPPEARLRAPALAPGDDPCN